MDGDIKLKIKKHSEKKKFKSRRGKRMPGFAMDFTYYSKILKAEQNKKKVNSGKTNSRTRNSHKNNILGSLGKGKPGKG